MKCKLYSRVYVARAEKGYSLAHPFLVDELLQDRVIRLQIKIHVLKNQSVLMRFHTEKSKSVRL